MNIVYRISAKDVLAYTTNCADCDTFCKTLIDNGILPNVRRMKRSDVPLNEIELVNSLYERK